METHTAYDAWLASDKARYLQHIPRDVKSVLDVGCGRGEVVFLLKEAGLEVEGCDIDDVLLGKSSRFAPVRKADVSTLSRPYPENSFDLLSCFHTLEHVLNPYDALQELRKVTRKYVLLAVPNARYIAHDEKPTHLYSWNAETLANLIRKAGFEILRLEQDRTNIFPNVLRAKPVINRILLRLFIGPNELLALCSK